MAPKKFILHVHTSDQEKSDHVSLPDSLATVAHAHTVHTFTSVVVQCCEIFLCTLQVMVETHSSIVVLLLPLPLQPKQEDIARL